MIIVLTVISLCCSRARQRCGHTKSADYGDNELNTTAVAPYSYIEVALPIAESAAREDADEWHPDDWDMFTSTNPQVASCRSFHRRAEPAGGALRRRFRYGNAPQRHRSARALIRPDPFAGGSSSDEGRNPLDAVRVVALVPDESEAHAHPLTTFGRGIHDASIHATRRALRLKHCPIANNSNTCLQCPRRPVSPASDPRRRISFALRIASIPGGLSDNADWRTFAFSSSQRCPPDVINVL
jgi:hypothetical protein